MPVYKYVNINPIYNKYSTMTKIKLPDTLNAISIAEELSNDLNTLISKKHPII